MSRLWRFGRVAKGPQLPVDRAIAIRWVLVAAIIVLALLLRVWGGDFGLPYTYHVDESAYVRTATKWLQGNHNPPYDPTGFANILALEYGALYVVGHILGVFTSLEDFVVFGAGGKLTVLILLSRFTSALLGTATVVVVYVLGTRVRSKMAGILAALFLAVGFMHVRDSHYGVPDITMTFFVTLCITLCVTAMKEQRLRNVVLAGVAGGLAIATKWIALPVSLSAVIVAFGNTGSSGESSVGRGRLRFLAASAMGFALGFALASPQILVRPGLYWGKVVEEFLKVGPESGIWQVDTIHGWLFYIKILGYGLGVGLLVLGILGALRHLVSVLRTRDMLGVLLLSFPLLYFLLMGSNRHYAWRYALPLVPFLALFAGDAVVIFSSWARDRRSRPAAVLAAGLVLVVIVQPLSNSIRHDVLLTRKDTRTLAKGWIEANIPAGAKIALDWPVFSPPLQGTRTLVPYSDIAYDVTAIGERGLPRYPLDWYRMEGFDYVVISSYVYGLPWSRHDSDRLEYYAQMDRELELVKTFSPFKGDSEPPSISDEMYGPAIHLWRRERPGPLIKVYRLG